MRTRFSILKMVSKNRLFIPLTMTLLTSFGSVAVQAHSIEPCYCDDGCYTQEVQQLSCSNGQARFRSNGLPSQEHSLMIGIEASNQQFPSEHNYQFHITTKPRLASRKTPTEAGPIGVAVNGISIFDPSTQAPVNPATGKRPNTYDVGELDDCGGHSGRGDDYHYHIAPKCLIEQLGEEHIEVKKRPIGFAMDGFPILALGWFDKANDVEALLDECRGMTDDQGRYFYNVKHEPKWELVNCLSGYPQKFARDTWRQRFDKNGRKIVGLPIKFKIKNYQTANLGGDTCHKLTGLLAGEQILTTSGKTKRLSNTTGDIFHCNEQCYGLFFEAKKKPQYRGRVLFYDLITSACPSDFDLSAMKVFEAYRGPAVEYMGEPPTRK